MLDKSLVTYNHEESITHHINPLLKLIIFFLYIIACFFPYNSIIFISLLVSVFILMLLSNISLLKYLQVLWFFRYILLIVYFFFYAKGMDLFYINILLFKIIFALLFLYVILFTVKRDDLSDSIASIFNIFNNNKIKSFFSNIFNFIIIFIDQTNKLYEVSALKGKDYYFSILFSKIAFFFKNYKEIYNISKDINKKRKQDMVYRMYNINSKKIYKYRSKLNVFDYVLIIVYIFIYVYYIVKVR